MPPWDLILESYGWEWMPEEWTTGGSAMKQNYSREEMPRNREILEGGVEWGGLAWYIPHDEIRGRKNEIRRVCDENSFVSSKEDSLVQCLCLDRA